MKKIIAMILIMVFCTCQYGSAVEIIVGSDGQAKYADGIETPIKQIDSVSQSQNIDNKITETQKTEEEKINIAVTPIKDANVNQADIDKIEGPYKSKNLKYIKKAPLDSYISDRNREYYERLKKRQDKTILKFNLQDGDYVLWDTRHYKSTQWAGEYHQDGSLMGEVQIKKINKKTLICSEYRIEDVNARYPKLKHIMIMYAEKNKEPVLFMYSKSGKLRCVQKGNKVYAIDLPNMPGVTVANMNYIEQAKDKYKRDSRIDTVRTIGKGCLMEIGFIALMPLAPVVIIAMLYIMYEKYQAN